MLRWLILIQAAVYLAIVPALRAGMEPGYRPSVVVITVALAALVLGGFIPALSRATVRPALADVRRLRPESWLWLAWLVLAITYALIVVRYGLFDRRQGSEVMAELYATLPLPVLAVLRSYELLLIPVVVLYAIGATVTQKWQRALVLMTALASLPFMGLADSRGRLIVMGMSLVAVVPVDRLLQYFYRYWQLLAGTIGAVFVFAFVSMQRAAQYGSIGDYLFAEVYVRLDGMNLATKLAEANLLSWRGSFDFAMAAPLLSKIPFLEAAQTAKLLGRTSTKQYVIQDLLRSTSLDDSNSMITDPLYFGGLTGLFIGFFLMMRGAHVFDRYILENRLLTNYASTAFALAFGTGIVVFENDWVGSFANILLTGALVLGFLALCTRREHPIIAFSESSSGSER